MDDGGDFLTNWSLPHDSLLCQQEICFTEQVSKCTRENGSATRMMSPSLTSTGRVIVHIDIDCFYAQVEMIHNPDCKDKPVGVQQKYLLVTCNYKARECGVTKMMGVKEAQKKCPDLIIFNGEDLTHYRDMSYKITEHFRSYTPLVERLGFDENFLDVTQKVDERISMDGSIPNIKGHLYGQEGTVNGNIAHQRLAIGSQIAWDLRQSVYETLGITCCAGIASNKLLAKLVAGTHKPSQQTTLLPEHSDDLMMSLQQCSDIPGIGHPTSGKLEAIGIQTISDLRQCDEQTLVRVFGDVLASRMKQLSYGDDPSPVNVSGKPQSLSEEDSFRKCSTVDDAKRRLTDIANKLLIRLLSDGRIPQTVKLSVRKYSSSVNKYTSRECRQCPIPSHIFTTFDKETVSQTSLRLCCVVWPLFCKLVNVNQPFHLTLLNLCFAKLVKNTPGIIGALFENMSQNQRKKGTLHGQHSNDGLQENCVLINQSQSEGVSSEPELDTTCHASGSQRQNQRCAMSQDVGDRIAMQEDVSIINNCSVSLCDSVAIEPLSYSSRKRKHQHQDGKEDVKRQSLHRTGVTGDKLSTSICETKSIYSEEKNWLSGQGSLGDGHLPYGHINSEDIDPSIVSELPAEIQCSIYQEYAELTNHGASVHLTSKSLGKGMLSSEQTTTQSEIPNNRTSLDSCVDHFATASPSVSISKDTGSMRLSDTRSPTPSSQSPSNPPDSLSTDMFSSPTRASSKLPTSLQKSPIPPDIDKTVFYQLPKDVQREMLAQWRWSVGASLSPSSHVQQNSKKSKRTDTILNYMRKS